ncbi:ABC transporter ATP-binding protein [Enterococcus asini]|uniref:ABC transporter ATP-binding protein n=1 Tax=Enterococcus asini TaxID=57732 RepID=UPI00288D8E9D|nr:ABC transporter ATP-binding protein [Enterococcus asini]MDT2757268.1 ABC transporter ATP-binding protein [Enterococcus asini]
MGILSFEKVTLTKGGQTLLQDINWQIKSGENWAILGLNGAGKSLLLQMIAGNLWPTSGKITVLGEVFGQTNLPDLSRRIGWVATVLQNKFYPQDLAEEIVLSGKFASVGLWQSYQASELLAAKELLHSLGCGHLLGKPYQVLSQGEKQLVLIARALMPKPQLLILDEPCTGLDLFAREELLQKIHLISQQPEAPTLLLVTHHTEEILPAINHVLMLKSGEIFKQGPRAELFTPEVLTAFYQKPIAMEVYGENRLIVYPKSLS